MQTIHKMPEQYQLSDVARKLAQGIRAYNGSEVGVGDLGEQNRRRVLMERAYVAIWALVGVENVGVPVVTYDNDVVAINHEPYIRSCKFLSACGFSEETINEIGITVMEPYGTI